MENTVDKVLEKENSYLAKVAAWCVGIITTVVIAMIGWQINTTKDNTEQLEGIRKDLNNMILSYNDRFNTLDNRLSVGQEKGSAVIERLDAEDKRIWEAIYELKKKGK